MSWFRESKEPTVQEVTVVLNQDEIDEAVNRIRTEIKKLDDHKAALVKTIREARTAQRELENTSAKAKRQGRGGW